jgi:hypothetical protein
MFHFREDHGAWLDLIVRVKQRSAVLPPQLYVYGERPIALASPEFATERLELLSQSVDAIAGAAKVIQPWEPNSPARLVYLPGTRGYVVRAQSEAHYAAFLDLLRAKLPDLAARAAGGAHELVNLSFQERPLVLPLGLAINDAPRCAAKMAFNFLSHYFGAEVALRAEFDGVRQYITGEKVDPVRSILVDEGETGVTVDTRYVGNWLTTNPTPSQWNLFREAHYIVLLSHHGELGAEVGLFGGRSRFLVRFGRFGRDLVIAAPLPAAFITPIGGGGDRVLAEYDLMDALEQAGSHVARDGADRRDVIKTIRWSLS